MTEPILVRFREPSHWESCRTIGDAVVKNFPTARSWFQDMPLTSGKLLLVDHRWIKDPQLIPSTPQRSIEIYLYGDFTLRIAEFIRLMDHLKTHDVKLIVASPAQSRLVSRIFPEYESRLEIRPYPVSFTAFAFSAEKRRSFRETFSLGETEKVFGYGGRICRQKGVIELLKSFLSAKTEAKLVLAGPLHPHPFWQFDKEEDDRRFLSEFTKLMELGKGNVHWTGALTREQMSSFYSGIDTFVSPGTFHDEDFNLTLSEALAAERNCAVTAWGGNLRAGKNVTYLNVVLGDHGYQVNPESLTALFEGREDTSKGPVKNPASMTKDELTKIRSRPEFLKHTDGRFDLSLYEKLYSAYL